MTDRYGLVTSIKDKNAITDFLFANMEKRLKNNIANPWWSKHCSLFPIQVSHFDFAATLTADKMLEIKISYMNSEI